MPLFGRRKPSPEPVVEPEPERLPDPPASGAGGLRSVEAHRDYLLSLVEPLEPFGMALLDAWGLAVWEDIRSDVALPLFDQADHDGFAVRASDVLAASHATPVTLVVTGSVAAGQTSQLTVGAGQAVRVQSGSPLPQGADAVVPSDATNHPAGGTSSVTVLTKTAPGEHVRTRGSDVTQGQLLVARGQRLEARAIGLLAAAGVDKVLARPRPRVVVVSTGAELVDPGRRLPDEAHLFDANGHLLAAAAKAAGAQVFRVPAHSDDAAAVRDVVSDQLIRADLVITTGGVDDAESNVVRRVVPELGLTDFASVAMTPGRPQGFGLVGEDRVPVVMLPGSPVSAYVSFQVFVLPLIRRLMGVEPVNLQQVRCTAESAMRSPRGVLQFGRGIVRESGGRRTVRQLPGDGSHLLGELASCNALVLLPPEVETVRAGEAVQCWLLDHE